ncbi:SGNH/GDSL hydrolase family protein [Mesonia aquimarina]|uniref:SGNH/GDSL hydrolase family protein n=1 Tax=Mesonia aquimarina TaxID=1504967 RepID=UPI000EF58800|nr:SGNH/GDSL hydrolase family protein [Mesonia aquimarina]
MHKFLYLFLGLLLCLSSCKTSKIGEQNSAQEKNYLALGDSYTIGESVPENRRWPVQLTSALNEAGFAISSPKIIAKTGWRTDDLLAAMNEELDSEKYDLVSVLIGVNNQYQGKPIEIYRKEFRQILDDAIGFSKTGENGVFVVSIPDYGVTPFGQESGKKNISQEIIQYNSIAKNICQEKGIPFYNITPISLEAESNQDLVAQDGLHPSGEMYKRWVEIILPEVKKMMVN